MRSDCCSKRADHQLLLSKPARIQLHALTHGAHLHHLRLALSALVGHLILQRQCVGVALQDRLDRGDADDELALAAGAARERVERQVALRAGRPGYPETDRGLRIYSCRNATSGSMREARRAGKKAAAMAIARSKATAAANTSGSSGWMPNNWLSTIRTIP